VKKSRSGLLRVRRNRTLHTRPQRISIGVCEPLNRTSPPHDDGKNDDHSSSGKQPFQDVLKSWQALSDYCLELGEVAVGLPTLTVMRSSFGEVTPISLAPIDCGIGDALV